MSKPLKYNFGGEYLTRVEIIKNAYDHAKNYPAEERKAYVKSISQLFSDDSMKNNFQTIYLPVAGALFLILILGATFLTPFPTQIQSATLWVILSLAAAACAAVIPGFIEFKYQGVVKAGGAIAIFCLMYFFSPNILEKTNQSKAAKISLYVVQEDGLAVQSLNPEFDPNSREALAKSVTQIINNYFGTKYAASHFTIFRKDDGKIYQDEICSDVRDYKLLVIPVAVENHFSDKRKAYLKFNALSEKR
ncbi:hypothetical protein [Mucilaginibacter sp. 5C4]|uniref:hypothetical protein n=1 Tax=Mucilaginibacter sp. 5C4 TaxID=3048589 RepID=UPI002AC954EA|nr:hypothetical protein [Mucilaginibacter sp. 5C4]MEB0301563.1 hypothetical protein [Mucilaginibacter sp. 5C4]WPX25312.1 hypothetical protein RHM67_08560 [Mucilaginibacter sp. 5C4]